MGAYVVVEVFGFKLELHIPGDNPEDVREKIEREMVTLDGQRLPKQPSLSKLECPAYYYIYEPQTASCYVLGTSNKAEVQVVLDALINQLGAPLWRLTPPNN